MVHFYKSTVLSTEMDLAFIINATSDVANVALELMKGTIDNLLHKYKNNHQVKFQILIHGKDDPLREICLKDGETDIELKRDTEVNTPGLHEDLKKVTQTSSQFVRKNSEKVVVNNIEKAWFFFKLEFWLTS